MITTVVHNPDPLHTATELIGDLHELPIITNHDAGAYYHARLCRWVAFFNDRFSKCLSIYSHTIVAIYRAFVRGGLILEQTEFEFNTSLKFYEVVLKENPHLRARRFVDVEELLIISLIYSKYPGLVVGSLIKASRSLQNDLNGVSNYVFFQELYIRYKKEAPFVFTRSLTYLNKNDTACMMFTLQGNSPRLFDNLPMPLSKRESHVFQTTVAKYFRFKNYILHKSVIAAKLLLLHPDVELLKDFFGANRYFSQDYPHFVKELDFWKQAFVFISKIDFNATNLSQRDFHDYFIHQRYTADAAYSLRNRTPNSVSVAIDMWHNNITKTSNRKLMDLKWDEPKTNLVYINGEEYIFDLITNGRDLKKESQAMRHCVFSYLESCANGQTSIWSAKKWNKTKFAHYLTIEVVNNEIVQVSRISNIRPNKQDRAIVRQWAEQRSYFYGG